MKKMTQPNYQTLRELCLKAGAEDVGFVPVSHTAIDADRKEIALAFPATKMIISIVCKMNVHPTRSPARSIANNEFHQAGHDVNDVCRTIVRELQELGIAALNPSMAFPMETEQWPEKMWVISHKNVAEAAGMGKMGIHRNVIHPKFGNFILLGSILVDYELEQYSEALDYNPCVDCKLCVAACPVGAISLDGDFNFSSCFTHNYREFMGGFTDWTGKLIESKDLKEYRTVVDDDETVSVWQSLTYGANYKAAYCVSVCPAGEDLCQDYVNNKAKHIKEIVKPLQKKEERIYVMDRSDAQAYVQKRFPHKQTKVVSSQVHPKSIEGFLRGLTLFFQQTQAKDLNATYHFTFTGKEVVESTVIIKNQQLRIEKGLVEQPTIRIIADSEVWLRFLHKDYTMFWALLRRKIKIKGHPKWLLAFQKCFPV